MEESVVFCATGISDSQLLPEVKFVGNNPLRAQSSCAPAAKPCYILAAHILSSKTIHLRSVKREENWIARAIISGSVLPSVARTST
jgi:fructose-1,6-bisphosphatase/sedoheptulose 1,7-bisphosphatase-like protein